MFTIAAYMNDKYKEIEFDHDLGVIRDRYDRKAKEALRNMKAQ